jgi:hypothetical protein
MGDREADATKALLRLHRLREVPDGRGIRAHVALGRMVLIFMPV